MGQDLYVTAWWAYGRPVDADPDLELTRADHRIGTATMLAGTVISAFSVLGFQIIAGRSLGTEDFAPIGVMWTVSFVVYTVLMIPVEQFITRRLVIADGARGALASDRYIPLSILTAAWVIGVGFIVVTLDFFFEGRIVFVVIGAVLFASRGLLAVGRGSLAGRRRYTAYGVSLMAEGIGLLAMAVVVALTTPSAAAYATIMALTPLTIVAFRPWTGIGSSTIQDFRDDRTVPFLGYLILATAASQLIIAGAPIVVRLIGGTATAVSIVFVTFTLFRGPVTSAYNLVARVLPDFTDLSVRGDETSLDHWRHRIAIGGFGLAAFAGLVSYLIGPVIVGTLYGDEFAPTSTVAALAGAGIGAGLGALFVGQIYIASGRTRRLAVGWVLGLLVAAVAVVVADTDPITRVAIGLAVGEGAALVILGFAPRRSTA